MRDHNKERHDFNPEAWEEHETKVGIFLLEVLKLKVGTLLPLVTFLHLYKCHSFNSLFRYIGENYRTLFSISCQGCSLEDIYHSIGVLSINNANLAMGEGHGKGAGLYVTYSRVNHGCTCNTKTLKYKDNR